MTQPRAVSSGRARLVELVGPAGAGKSTLASALRVVDPALVRGPSVWGLPRRHLAAALRTLLPMFVRAALQRRPFARAEMAQMIRLEALRISVERSEADGRPMLLDEGPVFGLTWLEVFYANGHDPAKTAWRRRTLECWAGRLDAVVRMDADDEAIARRIRSRAKPHRVKNAPDEEIREFTARFREAFDRVLSRMQACGDVAVHHVPSTDGFISSDAVRVRDTIAAVLRDR